MKPDYKIEIEYPMYSWEDKIWGKVTNMRYSNTGYPRGVRGWTV